jgi:hypothetical protein
MYPQVTQFETRQRLLLDEFQLQAERRLAGLPNTTPPGHTLAAASTAPAVLTRVVRAFSSR